MTQKLRTYGKKPATANDKPLLAANTWYFLSNERLWKAYLETLDDMQIMRRKWIWIGHQERAYTHFEASPGVDLPGQKVSQIDLVVCCGSGSEA